jgi:hypothetical protein
VIKGDAVRTSENLSYLLRSQGPLVLEGLELHMTGPPGSMLVDSIPGPLHVANCRFVPHGYHVTLSTVTPSTTVRNCEFVGTSTGSTHLSADLPNDGELSLENNVFASPVGHLLNLRWMDQDLHNCVVHLKHNTVVSPGLAILQELIVVPKSAEPGAAPDRQPVRMKVSENLFDPIARPDSNFCLLFPPDAYREDAEPLSAEEAEHLLPRLMDWREDRNLYCKGLTFQSIRRVKDPSGPGREIIAEPLPGCRTLAGWLRLWKAGESGSVEGTIRYEGGDVVAKMTAAPERTASDDFRLRPDSAGYRAGKDGKDLGADIDLVGPGEAYERWKKTPDYRQWLEESGQGQK